MKCEAKPESSPSTTSKFSQNLRLRSYRGRLRWRHASSRRQLILIGFSASFAVSTLHAISGRRRGAAGAISEVTRHATKIVKLIDRYSNKITELKAMNDKFVHARGSFDEMMEQSLSKYNPGGQSSQDYLRARPDFQHQASASSAEYAQHSGWNGQPSYSAQPQPAPAISNPREQTRTPTTHTNSSSNMATRSLPVRELLTLGTAKAATPAQRLSSMPLQATVRLLRASSTIMRLKMTRSVVFLKELELRPRLISSNNFKIPGSPPAVLTLEATLLNLTPRVSASKWVT